MDQSTSLLPKARYVVAIILITYFYLPGLGWVYSLMGFETPLYWFNLAVIYYAVLFQIVLISVLVLMSRLDWTAMFQRLDRVTLWPSLQLTAYLYLFAIAAMYALFYPLSFIVPDFVNYWLIDLPPFVFTDETGFPVIPNVLSIISLVVFAPIVEEFIFRGLLLHRWAERFGLIRAIVFSSLLFGVLHPDPLGAMVFGVGMCVIYLKTQSLWVPIICHAAYNLFVWVLELGFTHYFGPASDYTLEDFQEGLWYGLVAAALVTIVTILYFRKPMDVSLWHLPRVGNSRPVT